VNPQNQELLRTRAIDLCIKNSQLFLMQSFRHHGVTVSNTVLWSRGCGPPLLVIHGGPGFEHGYLSDALRFLEPNFKLIYYDQIGCGETSGSVPPTLLSTAKQLAEVIALVSDGSKLSVFAHSWGALVLAAAAAEPQYRELIFSNVSGGLLVNPVPLSKLQYTASYQAFMTRVPSDVQRGVQALATSGADGSEIMRQLWPYYSVAGLALSGKFPLNYKTYTSVTASMDAFDYTAQVEFLSRCSVLLSDSDPTSPFMLGELPQRCRRFEMLGGVGHFPLIEQPNLWRIAMLALLN
jgi:proline iminopeptidase